ncbi:efflux RND transporter periplasmic adaptor subunit [Solilutibacter silvestris]|uniref:RND efflux transporter n=1 Tax=Solilutibacter silvestris TaxID=1645665 RepID=A0A2K1Q1B6_9GAMM|nr:efflux RND transporter periplasmic adaptor subunit [Lysobacter silvestris]PNS08839.1 RND efflux transporter [Lysobacter silvestris]
MSLSIRRLALVACLLAIVLPGCKKQDDAATKAAEPALTVSVIPVLQQQVANGLTVSGPVSPVEEMQLGVEISGQRVTALKVDVGQWVKAGQVLLTLDHRTLDAALAQADANLKQAQAGAVLAKANLVRGEGLAKDHYISASQLDQLRAAKLQADAQLATAQAARDASALQRSFAELRAPANGQISKRLVQPGQIAAGGTELMRLIRDGKLEWRAELPASQLSLVKPGDRIALRGRDGEMVEGRVRAVSPGVDASSRTGTMYADLPQPQGLHPGTYLEGRIDTGLADSPVVPSAAIVLRDGFQTVFVVDAQNKVHATRIDTGSKDGGQVQVLRGLKAGDRVVVEGTGFLADGDVVKVVAPSAAGVAKTGTTP